MKTTTLFAAAWLSLGLAACGSSNEAGAAKGGADSMPAGVTTPGMSPTAAATTGDTAAKGTGTVTAVDQAGGTITLDHGPIPEANWPAMTMAFKAAPPVLGSVKVGDKVSFDVRLANGAGEVTAIRKQ